MLVIAAVRPWGSVRLIPPIVSALIIALAGALPALAAPCEPPGGFPAWLDAFKRDAATAGISQRTLASAFVGIGPDPKVLGLDRNQQVFHQTFEEFSGRMISLYRLQKGGSLLTRNADTLAQIEQQYGVPGAVLVAIWGLETDFGANVGKFPTIRALATLAYDCRRSEQFQGELASALQIIDHGDLAPGEMHGAWAGEIGQTQFLPSSYLKFAVDFDGNGRRDLIHSAPDALASTANFLKGSGWQAGQGWQPGQPNFEVLRAWNKSEIYSRTVAAFAQRLQGQ